MDELIEKYKDKHFAILDEYSKGHANSDVMKLYRSRMKDIIEIIDDLEKLKTLQLWEKK